MSGLRKGWVQASIRDLCELINGKAFKPSDWTPEGLPIVRIQNLNNPNSAFNHYQGLVEEKFLIEDGQLLFAWSGTPGTSFGAHVWNGGRAVLNQHIFKVNFPLNLINKHFLRNAINQKLEELIGKAHGGAGLQHVTKGKFEDTLIYLPPLAEQNRIVAKLDALNAKSARARTELARIETLVSRYKQAVLSKAFSGELVGLAPHVTEKPHALCWDLPSGWRWVAFEDAVEIASNLVSPDTIPELPHIAPDNIESGTARLLPFKTIGEDGVISAKHRFFSGQILYSKIRPYLRKAVIADFDGACSADMYPLSPRDVLSARYLLQWLVSEQFMHFAVEHQGRTVLPKINQSALNKTPLPLPPLATQHEIVRRIESAFARIDRLAKEAKRALELVGRLDEAILAKAFRGELVPQDEIDEPAEHLLARIRAEREAAPKGKRGRKATI